MKKKQSLAPVLKHKKIVWRVLINDMYRDYPTPKEAREFAIKVLETGVQFIELTKEEIEE